MADAPDKVRRLVLASFSRKGLQVVEGTHVKAIEDGMIHLSDGRRMDYDIAFAAIGIRPLLFLRRPASPPARMGITVNPFFKVWPIRISLGVGIVSAWRDRGWPGRGLCGERKPDPLPQPMATLEGGRMVPSSHRKIPADLQHGGWKGNLLEEELGVGKPAAFLLKDYIDRKFMRKFQVSGELNERFDGSTPLTFKPDNRLAF